MNQYNNKNIVVIPTYNEASNIERLVLDLLNEKLSVLVVDDNSPDGTSNIVKGLQVKYKNVFLIQRQSKLGYGSAYREGFSFALQRGFNSIIQMDADFSHTIKDLKLMLQNIGKADIVIGSRYVIGGSTKGWSIFRVILSKVANNFSKFLCGYPVNDSTSGFRIYSSKALNSNNYESTNSDGYSFQIEMTFNSYQKNLTFYESPITFYERRAGKSKMNKKIILEAIFLILKIWYEK